MKPLIRNLLCKDLIVIDQGPLFKGEKRKCAREQARLDDLKKTLEDFERLEKPRFTTWFYSAFAEELAHLRLLQEELMRKIALVEDVEDEINSGKSRSYGHAFEKLSKSFEETWEQNDLMERPARQTGGPVGSEPRGEDSYGDDPYNDAWADTEHESFSRPDREAPPIGPKPRPPTERAKELYRELVRQLHPDLNQDLTERQRDLWHQVQNAYQTRDVAELERLASLATTPATNCDTSLSSLRKTFQELRSSCNELLKTVRRLKKDPAWGFRETLGHPERLDRLRLRLALDLRSDQDEIGSHLEELEAIFASWQEEASLQREWQNRRHAGRPSRQNTGSGEHPRSRSRGRGHGRR